MATRVVLSSVLLGGFFLLNSSYAIEEHFCPIGLETEERCVEDVLSLRFPATGTSELTVLQVGDEFELVVILDANTPPTTGGETAGNPRHLIRTTVARRIPYPP